MFQEHDRIYTKGYSSRGDHESNDDRDDDIVILSYASRLLSVAFGA